MDSFRDIITAFGGGAALAREIGVKPVTVRAWGLRNSIPPEYWLTIDRLAHEHRIRGATIARMAELSSNQESAA
jgi:DNA-binding transcriptional regulator YdaS (Cro superfamily)